MRLIKINRFVDCLSLGPVYGFMESGLHIKPYYDRAHTVCAVRL